MAAPLALGIDIGGTNTVFGLVDIDGTIYFRHSLSTKSYEEASLLVDAIAGIVHNNIPPNHELVGIGIGAPNGNYYSGCIEFAPNLPWAGTIPLTAMFAKVFGLPATLTNDANAAAVGEMIYGAAKGMKDFIMITLGTGLGSGIVVNGEVLYGHMGNAGELGHTIVYPGGRECGCGRNGCLETYASATGITRTVIELLSSNKTESSLRNISVTDLNSKIIYNAACQGDPIALEAFDFTCKVLGMQLADAVAFSGPEAIILFGGLANAKEFILEPTRLYMEDSILRVYKDTVKILPSELPESDAALLGAAALMSKLLLF